MLHFRLQAPHVLIPYISTVHSNLYCFLPHIHTSLSLVNHQNRVCLGNKINRSKFLWQKHIFHRSCIVMLFKLRVKCNSSSIWTFSFKVYKVWNSCQTNFDPIPIDTCRNSSMDLGWEPLLYIILPRLQVCAFSLSLTFPHFYQWCTL